ncbi:hypothetical protein MTLP_12180 [Candidatus Methanoliparum sp. LAM-1]|nr:hypothetical protein MTLP_12180 [Candidatus Methanoliparum sp. LAM-1]
MDLFIDTIILCIDCWNYGPLIDCLNMLLDIGRKII